MTPERIPVHANDSMMFLLWSIEETAIMFMGLGIGILMKKTIICVLIAYVVLKLFRKIKDSKPDSYGIYIAYWLGIIPSKCRTLVNPYIRRFIQ